MLMCDRKLSPLLYSWSIKIFKVKKILEGKNILVVTVGFWGHFNRENLILLQQWLPAGDKIPL